MVKRHTHRGEPHTLYSLMEWRALFEMALLPYATVGRDLAGGGRGSRR
jgi:hypothetical protein